LGEILEELAVRILNSQGTRIWDFSQEKLIESSMSDAMTNHNIPMLSAYDGCSKRGWGLGDIKVVFKIMSNSGVCEN